MLRRLNDELRWTFTWPFGWLQGVIVNVLLAALYVVILPFNSDEHFDKVFQFSVYFVSFILADVTTTNIFGHDMVRFSRALAQGRSFLSLVLLKNCVQIIVVAIPAVLFTLVGIYVLYGTRGMILSIPRLLYPILLWLGMGNIVSVLYPGTGKEYRRFPLYELTTEFLFLWE